VWSVVRVRRCTVGARTTRRRVVEGGPGPKHSLTKPDLPGGRMEMMAWHAKLSLCSRTCCGLLLHTRLNTISAAKIPNPASNRQRAAEGWQQPSFSNRSSTAKRHSGFLTARRIHDQRFPTATSTRPPIHTNAGGIPPLFCYYCAPGDQTEAADWFSRPRNPVLLCPYLVFAATSCRGLYKKR
jgi:hypothetical protein